MNHSLNTENVYEINVAGAMEVNCFGYWRLLPEIVFNIAAISLLIQQALVASHCNSSLSDVGQLSSCYDQFCIVDFYFYEKVNAFFQS